MMSASSLEALFITKLALSIRVTDGKSLLIFPGVLLVQDLEGKFEMPPLVVRSSSDDPDVAVRDVGEELLLRRAAFKTLIGLIYAQ